MESLDKYKRVYFVGAGGIGMAALVRYCLSRGLQVAGYDRTPSDLTAHLQREGAQLSFDDAMKAVPEAFRDPADTLVVYTPAVPDDNVPLTFFRTHGFEVVKRAALLGMISRQGRSLCFAGTHGKTTTSSMAAHILHTCPVGCTAFLGGVLRNYDSNLLLSATSPYIVAEADEYDRSFHHLTPFIGVVTATDPDHLDIYGTKEAYLEAFSHFTELIQPGGALLMHTGLEFVPRVQEGVRIYTYGRDEGYFHAANIRRGGGEVVMDFVSDDGFTIRDISLGVPVEINIENVVCALAACYLTGDMQPAAARQAMHTYQGAERRFQFWLREPGPTGRVVIDDYAHHPDEIRQSLASVKALYPGRRITAVFQPHLYTRTRDFAPQFAQALSQADDVWLTDIYPAREQPIPGVTSEIILRDVTSPHKRLIAREDIVDTLRREGYDILMTLGAGNLNLLLPELLGK